MHVSRALLKNTRASLRFHKRLMVFLVAMLVVIVGLVALSSGLPQILTAGAGGTTDPLATGDQGTGSNDYGSYISETFTEATSTPTPSTSTTPSATPPDPTFTPLQDTPEFGIGGAVIALFTCFMAFTLFMRRKSTNKQA
jgi:hypothetical protein